MATRRFAPAALIQEAKTAPAAFSPNVLLRPIVQDTLFPTICYVAGPNELAYLGQLRQIYERFGVPMPLMYPRASATLVDSGALRFFKIQAAARGAAAAGRIVVESASRGADSDQRRRLVFRRFTRHRNVDGAG